MKKKILVVDDNQLMLKFITRLLKKEGHEVLSAEDGIAALDLLAAFTPDIMFVDLVMPKIGGDKLCKIVRKMQHLEECRLVLITAAAAELEFEYQEIGADACIAKGPFASIADHVLNAVKDLDDLEKTGEPKSIAGLDEVSSRQMTKELLSQNRHLEAILDGVAEAILEVYSGKIIYANTAAVALFGIRQENLLATYFVDLFKPVDQQRVKVLLRAGTDKANKMHSDKSLTINDRQVTIKTFSKKGMASTSIIMIADVTRRRRMEFQRHYSQKISAVTRLAGDVSKAFGKQLRGLQETISKFAEEMDARVSDTKRIREIDRYTRKMTDLTRQLSEVNEIEKVVPEQTINALQTGSETVLLVDGTEITSKINRFILEELGYKVLVARTGKSAVGKYRARSDKKYNRIDLVIVDELLPDMEADELCREIKEIDSGAKILMSVAAETGNNGGIDRTKGANGIVEKPFNIRRVASKIRETLDEIQAV